MDIKVCRIRKIRFCNLKRDLENTTNKYVLIKEQAYLFELFVPYLPRGFKHTFLIRDPSRVFASFRKAFAGVPEFAEHLPPDFNIIRDDFSSLTPMLWFEKLHKMWKYVRENIDPNPVIIDAFDIVSRPESTLKAMCEAVGLPYSEALLHWEAGHRFPDNVVTASPDVHTQRFLYGAALDSTHFAAPPPEAAGPIPRDQLTDDVIRCVEYSMPFYQEMYDQRLKACTD